MNNRQKKKQIKIRNKKLIKRYPWLLPRNIFTDKLPKDYDYSYTSADCFSEGWRKAFFVEMHEEIREELIRCNYLDKFRVMDIKEKYAHLCYYIGSIPMDCKVYDIIRRYEHISQYICIDCGKLGVPVIDNGWLTPICEKCYNEREKNRKQRYEYAGLEYGDIVPYEKLLEKVKYDYTLKNYYEVDVCVPGNDWETIKIDISDLAKKLKRKEKC